MRAFRIAYDGRPFSGFQRQPDVPTVEDALLDALESLGVLDPDADAGAGHRPTPPGYAAAGRTDAGVSATAQTVAFQAPGWLTPRALSGELPAGVHAWAHADVPSGDPEAAADFHATRDASRRGYVYHYYGPKAEPAALRDALAAVEGEHDFAALTPDDQGTVRRIETDLETDGPWFRIRVTAGGFPRYLVRRIVGLLELLGTGERDLSFLERVLAPSVPPERTAVPTAAAEPLVLDRVVYPELDFRVDERAAAMASEALGERHARAATRARVTRDLRNGVQSE